jgi:predicted nucleic acid-binding protein
MRAVTNGELAEAEAAARRGELNAAAAHWTLLRLSSEVIDRARQRFPDEPVRTLDALHLASALLAKSTASDTVVLSIDDRVRANARALGFDCLPS